MPDTQIRRVRSESLVLYCARIRENRWRLRWKHSGRWLEAVPTSSMLAMDPCVFRLAASVRLGCPLAFTACFPQCECGKPIDILGYHALTCKHGGGPVFAHNKIVSGWMSCIRDAGLTCEPEPRGQYLNNDDRPDIKASGIGSGVVYELDVSLAHPWASEVAQRAAVQDGAAAAVRDAKKRDKYQSNRRPAGVNATFIPLVFEHFGRWGDGAEKFLGKLGSAVEIAEGKTKKAEFLCYWRRRLSLLAKVKDRGMLPE
eukprot:m.255021 g.255021  ORF g.255021 m.255021 type:complete len:257 (+) comp40390_c0_seq2:157-927(+)